MSISLRAIGLDERDVVAGITIEPEAEDYSGGRIDDIFERMRASPPGQLPFALVDGDAVVGFIVVREGAALPVWATSGSMSLHNLRIDRRFRGHGFGRSAMRLVGRWIAKQRPAVTHVMASVNVENLAAIRFNLGCGFLPTGMTVDGRLGLETILIVPVERLGADQPASTNSL